MLFLLLLLPMAGLVTEAFFASQCDDMDSAPCIRGCSRGLKRDFNGVANRFLAGYGYRNLTVASPVLCGRECLMDDGCFSFHYSEGERRCELNGATASRHPMALIQRDGAIYYGPEETRLTELLANGREVAISLTDCWYHTHAAAAASECNKTGQHLCLQWEVDHASEEGYPVTPPYGSWYADPDSLAVLSETGVTYHDLPLTAPSPGLCCSLPMSYRDPVLTQQGYDLADRVGQMKGCSDLAAHLCTLAELKEAYDHGYRSELDVWYYYATPNRDVAFPEVGCNYKIDVVYTGEECYQGVIINTPRPPASCHACCCPNRA